MVGQLVLARMEARGYNQSTLSKASSGRLRQSYISQVVRGDIELPREDKIALFTELLGISREEFYRAAGVLVDTIEGDASPDDPLAIMVERVRRDPRMMRDLRRAQEINTPEVFERILAAVADAWRANLRMAMAVNSAEADPVPPSRDPD